MTPSDTKTNWKKPFAIIYAGQAFSIIGSAAVQFAIIWYITVRTESALALTLSTVVGFLPSMFISPFAGVFVDRYNRRSVMMAADGLVALASAVLAVAFLAMGQVPIWFLYIILFLRGLGSTFHGPAMQAAIPMLVPPDMLTKAGGWGNLINSLGNMLGPALGAVLMETVPLAAVMLVDIVGAFFAIVCLLFVRIPDIPRTAEKPHVFSDIKQGFLAVRSNKPLLAVFGPMILVNIVFMPLGSLYPLLVRVHFGGTAWHSGVTEFVFAGGMLVSSLVIGVFGGMKRRFLMVSLAILLLGATTVVSGALPQSAFPVFVAMTFLMGTTGTFINVPLMAYTQQTTPPDMMGKVFSLMMMAMTISTPVGLFLAGPVSEWIGIEKWFLYSGIAMLLNALCCWLVTRRFDRPGALPALAGDAGAAPEQPPASGEGGG